MNKKVIAIGVIVVLISGAIILAQPKSPPQTLIIGANCPGGIIVDPPVWTHERYINQPACYIDGGGRVIVFEYCEKGQGANLPCDFGKIWSGHPPSSWRTFPAAQVATNIPPTVIPPTITPLPCVDQVIDIPATVLRVRTGFNPAIGKRYTLSLRTSPNTFGGIVGMLFDSRDQTANGWDITVERIIAKCNGDVWAKWGSAYFALKIGNTYFSDLSIPLSWE